MKHILWRVTTGSIVVLTLVCFGVGCGLFTGLTETTDGFFTAVKQNDMASAQIYLSEAFKANTDANTLANYLIANHLNRYQSASWNNRQIASGRGTLEGAIKTDDGGTIPIKIVLVKENNAWKIFNIEIPSSGPRVEGGSTLPSNTEAIALVKRSIRDFTTSLDTKDMTTFYRSLSQMWQQQTTPAQLATAFQSFLTANQRWSVLNDVEPILSSAPAIDADGLLVLVGYYPTEPNRVLFEQKYIREGVDWKLIGINVNSSN